MARLESETESERELAERVRRACLEAALDAYEDAGLQGLCAEGRWECALEAIRRLPLNPPPALAPSRPSGDPAAGPTETV